MFHLNAHLVEDDKSRVLANLAQIVACSAAELGGNDRLLLVAGQPVAIWEDLMSISATVSCRGHDSMLVDTVAGLLASRPTGVMVLGTALQEPAVALLLRDGAAVGAVAPGPLGTQGAFVLEFQRRRIAETRDDRTAPPSVDACRTFLQETVLNAMSACDRPGGTLLWITGKMRWIAEELPVRSISDASFLLLEQARRADEMPRLRAAVGALDRIVVPLSRPGLRVVPPSRASVGSTGDEDDWDFFDDPDSAADLEWSDARLTFGCCDGASSIADLADRTMLGEFRTLQAVLALFARNHIVAIAATRPGEEFDAVVAELDGVG